MASLSPDPDERFRPADPKNTRSPKAKSSSLRHKTRSPADAVRESELALRQLLEDFEEGRLNAFGMCQFIVRSSVMSVNLRPTLGGDYKCMVCLLSN